MRAEELPRPEPTRPSLSLLFVGLLGLLAPAAIAAAQPVDLDRLEGLPAEISSSAYLYRADRAPDLNPPEAWILLVQYAGLPFDGPVDRKAPALRRALSGILWEEVRPVRRVVLSWPAGTKDPPATDEVVLSYLDGADGGAHTWWNPCAVREAGQPEVTAGGRTWTYSIPADTWGVVAAMRGDRDAAAQPVPDLQAFVTGRWKRIDLEIEWGYEEARAGLGCDGRLEVYDGMLAGVRPLGGDAWTAMTGPAAWRSPGAQGGRRGVRLGLLYLGESRWRRVWPYHSQAAEVARTIVTVWTDAGGFSFLAADLEEGPILAPEHGFFIRAAGDRRAKARETLPPEELLTTPVNSLPGVPLVRGWTANGEIPWFGVNAGDEQGLAGSLRIPPHSALMHPLPERDVAFGWRSAIAGRVSVKANVAMADARGGNGIEWAIVLEGRSGRSVLDRGAIGTGGSQSIPTPAGAGRLGDLPVEKGEMISLVVGAKDRNHFCDTTLVQLSIAETGSGGRTWSLAKDVVPGIHDGNPHADASGNTGVWRFYSLPTQAELDPSRPPFERASRAASAREYLGELAAKKLSTIRQRTRVHVEETWEEAVEAMRGSGLPPHPEAPFEPAMQVEVPSGRLTAQWRLGAWHLLRHASRDEQGRYRFNDHPFGILASETYQVLRALDLLGMHREAADGLEQWLSLPLEPRASAGTHSASKPDRPLGHFSDGRGCLTHAVGPEGAGGHMDAVHCMGPGAIMLSLAEHFRLTGDRRWLEASAPRMKANVEWILRQRQETAKRLPAGERLWSRGLQPAHVVTPDSLSMHMQFYETEAYYWLAVRSLAELLAEIDPPEAARIGAEAEAYRRDLLAAIDRSIALTPVVAVRDGTYRSFIPFAPYVRGFAAGAWGWRRCQGHVGAIYWDTVQSADPLISPAGLLSSIDPRVQGHLDVLEDRLLLENEKVASRTPGFEAERDWFARASWQYQCGLERHANIHLAADDPPNFLRSMLNQYAVDIVPGEYTFREHTTGGPLDKIYEEACFLERFRMMLVMEEGDALWLLRAAPRGWFEEGKRISLRNAPTHFGEVDCEVTSRVDRGLISARVKRPTRRPPNAILLRLRHPARAPITGATVDGKPWTDFDPAREIVRLPAGPGEIELQVKY